MLHTDTRHDLVQSFFVPVARLSATLLAQSMYALCDRARALLADDGVADAAIELVPAADLRYVGQEYSVTVPWSLEENPAAVVRALPERFAAAHLDRYGHNNPGESVECVNLRMTALGRIDKIPSHIVGPRNGMTPTATEHSHFDGAWHETRVYRRESLGADATVVGPAIVLENACTTAVPPRWAGTVSSHGHLILEWSAL